MDRQAEQDIRRIFLISRGLVGGVNFGPGSNNVYVPSAGNPPYTRIAEFGVAPTWSRPTQVPEPGSFGLLGIGLLGMALNRKRRKA
jgi:hypothetical protein